jgi:hypothetical protein
MTPRRIQMRGPATGACPVCARTFQLRADGTVRQHGSGTNVWPPANCTGAGQFPAPTPGRIDAP